MIDMSELGNFMCPDWTDFPIGINSATGGLLGTSPIICGGWSEATDNMIHDCFKIDSMKVKHVGKMLAVSSE